MSNQIDTALRAMTEAVRAASACCRAVQAAMTDADAVRKDDLSPVTVADLASQAIVSRALAEALPSIPLMGEEDASPLRGGDRAEIRAAVVRAVARAGAELAEEDVLAAIDRGTHAGGASGAFFTLDPIDGTKGFLRREQYAVALALVVDGRVTAGVLGCPNLAGGRILSAARGRGAVAEEMNGSGAARVRVSGVSRSADIRLAESVESAHSDRGASESLAARLGTSAAPVRMDSQGKYALLATGGADLYLRTPTKPGRTEWIWDHAAGVVILEEAGGRVTDLDGRALDFGAGRRLERNRGIVATNGLVHDAVLAAL